jgi:hypothetical protein
LNEHGVSGAVRKDDADRVTISGGRDGSGFVLRMFLHPERGLAARLTVTPLRGQPESYFDDRLEAGMRRAIDLYHGRSTIRLEATGRVSDAYPVAGLRVHYPLQAPGPERRAGDPSPAGRAASSATSPPSSWRSREGLIS